MSTDGAATPSPGLSRGRELPLPELQAGGGDVLRGDASDEPAAGPSGETGGTASSVLARAAALRFPDLRELSSGRERVDALIDHIVATAIARGELEELRLETQVDLLDARDRLRRIPVPGGKSKPAAEEARRVADPDLAARVDRGRWLVERCTEAINRMGGTDYDAASRAYTLIAGS